jgi:hypothetical protein
MCMNWTLYNFKILLCFLQALLIYILKDEVDVINIFVSYFNFWVEQQSHQSPSKQMRDFGCYCVTLRFECCKKKKLLSFHWTI